MINYHIVNHQVHVVDPDDGSLHYLCENVEIIKVIIDLLAGTHTVEVKIHGPYHNQPWRMSKGKLNHLILPELVEHGLSLYDNPEHVALILQVLWESEPSANHVYEHRSLGFHEVDGKQVFLANKPIGQLSQPKADSTYYMAEATAPKGTFESWQQLIKTEVVGKPNLELGLALGATSPVAYILKEQKAIELLPMYALVGPSSSGKSVTLKLMTSMFFAPEESGGLIKTLNTTRNAFYAQLGNEQGWPILIDEASEGSSADWDFTGELYSLPTGKDKLRCNTDGSLRQPVEFSGSFVFASENSFFDRANSNPGLLARLVEFTLPWTDDAEHADRLLGGLKKNYATAVVPLITWLMAHKEELVKAYYYQLKKIRDAFPIASGIEERIFKSYAVVLVSAMVVKAALKIPLEVKKMREQLLELHEKNERLKNRPEIIYEKLKMLILDNYGNFASPEASFPRKVWGEQGNYKGESVFWIDAEKGDRLLSKSGAKDLDKIKRTFGDNGWMVRTTDRRYKIPHSLGGVRILCYCFKFNMLHSGAAADGEKMTSKLLSGSKIKQLLGDNN